MAKLELRLQLLIADLFSMFRKVKHAGFLPLDLLCRELSKFSVRLSVVCLSVRLSVCLSVCPRQDQF